MSKALLLAAAAAACSSDSRRANLVQQTPLSIDATDAIPGQVAPGAAVTLSWKTSGAEHATLGEGDAAAVDVAVTGSQVVHPSATTRYTLTAYNRPGATPATLTTAISVRVVLPPSVGSFVANPSAIIQGDASTLSWTGDAVSYRVSDGTTSFMLGPRRSLLVRPAATTTYRLQASGPAGDLPDPPKTTVTVTPHPGSSLAYTDPATGAVRLVADACPPPCTSLTLRLLAAAPVQLRGAALDLPLDVTKVTFDRAGFGPGSAFAAAASGAALGAGPLQDALVVGIALKGTGFAPAADVALAAGDELAHFTLALNPAGGRGIVFDGFVLAAGAPSSYKAILQSASGKAANAIAVGRLEAQ